MVDQAKPSANPIPRLSIKRRLARAAAANNIPSDAVEHLFRSIDCHESLRGFIRRLRTLREILLLEVDGDRLIDEVIEFPSWLQFIELVFKSPKEFVKVAELTGEEAKGLLLDQGRDPLHPQVTDHEFESLLWITERDSRDTNLNRRFHLLQAQILLAQSAILRHEYQEAWERGAKDPEPSVFESVSRAAREAKRFARKGWLTAVGLLPVTIDRVEYRTKLAEVAESLDGTLPSVGTDPASPVFPARLKEALSRISNYLERGLEPGSYEKRENAKFEERTRRMEIYREPLEDWNGANIPDFEAQIVTRLKGTHEQRKALDEMDECPADHLPRRDFMLVSGSALTANWIRAAYERANQLLPRAYLEPHPQEYHRLLRTINEWTQQVGNEEEGAELAAWTEAIFWLSCSAKQATDLMVGFRETNTPDCDFYLCLGNRDGDISPAAASVRVRAIEPPYRGKAEPLKEERTRNPYIEFVDRGGLYRSIRSLLCLYAQKFELDISPTAGVQSPIRIFTRELGWYCSRLADFIQQAGLGDRVTVAGLGQVLFHRAIEQGDIVSASLITCRDHRLASVRRWYATYSIEHLRKVHSAACESLFADLRSVRPDLGEPIQELPTDPLAAGSRRCVLEYVLGERVKLIKRILRQNLALSRPEEREDAFVHKHNMFTLFALWTVEICVGMRAINHPYFHPSEYDPDTGLGTFTDKDPGGGKKSRLFRLPKLARSIMSAYDRYLGKLSKFGLPEQSRALPCYFVEFRDRRPLPVPVTPSAIGGVIGDVFKFAPNWGRRFVKTCATESGISPVHLDQYCGHFYRGEESFNPYSSADPLEYLDSMDSYIIPLLERLGFEAIDLESCL